MVASRGAEYGAGAGNWDNTMVTRQQLPPHCLAEI